MIHYIQQFLIVLLFVSPFSLPAQNMTISGKVTEQATGKVLPGVIVTLCKNGNSKVLKFAQTNADGIYTMTFAEHADGGILQFSMMGYAHASIPLKAGQTHYDVQLLEQATHLKEVIVKARGIGMKGDTISYNVSKYASEQDKTLADVLKKLPGIEVADNGSIKFNGKPINKFYIEGRDLLDGRYGMATNNIQQKDVGTVNVIENHQPVKALDKLTFSDDPAINIRLKDKARSRWVGTLKIGGGMNPSLWNSELFAMRFTKTKQTLDVYKTNNIGTDIWKDMNNFSLNPDFYDYNLRSFIDVSTRQLSQLDSRRSRFNKTHMFSTNNLWGLGKDYDLASSISYLNNSIHSNSNAATTYYLEDGKTHIIQENESAVSRQNRLNADLVIKANTDKFYLQNKLNVDLQWNNNRMAIEGTYPNQQHSSLPYRKITDSFDWIKRKGDHAFEICSNNSWQQKPQNLIVERNSMTQHQLIRSSAFFTDTYTQLTHRFSPFTFSAKLGLKDLLRSFHSELTGISDTVSTTKNKVLLDNMSLYVIPKWSLITSSVEVTFSLPISYQPYFCKDKIANRNANKSFLLLSPSLYLRYIFSPRLALAFNASIQRNDIDEQSFYEGFILNDYQHLSQGLINYQNGSHETIGLNLTYRNPMDALFAYLQTNMSWSKKPHSFNQTFWNDYIAYSFLPQSHFLRFWYLDGDISKGLDVLNSTISLNASYQSNATSIFQNSTRTHYTSSEWNIQSKLVTRFTEWLNLNYKMNFGYHILRMTDSHSHLKDFSQKGQCCIIPSKNWYIQLECEHYRNDITPSLAKNCLLADADITYHLKNGWELNLSAQNIFNRKQYSYRMYNGTTDVYESYRIRPRNITINFSFSF